MYNPMFNEPDALEYPPSSFPRTPPPLLTITDHLGPCFEFDSVSEAMKALNYPDTPYNSSSSCCSSGGSCISSPSSFPSCGSHVKCNFMQRSCSSLSLQKNYGYCLPSASTPEFADAEDSTVRRVCSTGDLQGQRSGSQFMSESNLIIEGLSRTCRYSPEEKKERIERYRRKRNERNFNKKIKYACRKTLADSRPRIRGRFARNDEIEKTGLQLPWNHCMEGEEEEEEEEDNNWINFLDAISSGNLLP